MSLKMSEPNIFQGGNLIIENPQSREEDEELEEHRRRQEELEDLLADGINEFKYGESTINSSTSTSFDVDEVANIQKRTNPLNFNYEDETTRNSITNKSQDILDNLEQNYRDAVDPNEQLKILYEVRMREIQVLKDEFSNYQMDKSKEIGQLKNKLTLYEAEVCHLQLAKTNVEELLVEKTEIINNLKLTINDNDKEIMKLKRQIEEMKVEICGYSSSISELQLKLVDNHPFSASARNFNTEELQKAHHDQVLRLEAHLEEQTKRIEILERKKHELEQDLKNVMKSKLEHDEECDVMIVELTKKLKNSQQQCKDLYNLGEAIKKESDHFKERLMQIQGTEHDLSSSLLESSALDHETLLIHLEKLKRMLLDKNVEMNTLQMKVKLYETDMEELFDYRKILNDMKNSEIKSCNVEEHKKLFMVLRQQLQRNEEILQQRNEEITNLHLINKESREKIEEMLQQTRTDIQNLSNRYSLPQLQQMSEDLKNAEQTIIALRAQLDSRSDDRELLIELEKTHQQISNLQQKSCDDKANFEEMLNMIKNDLKRSEDEIISLKSSLDELRRSECDLKEENTKINNKLRDAYLKFGNLDEESDVNELKTNYDQVKEQLRQVMAKLEGAKTKYSTDNIKVVLKLKEKFMELRQKLQEKPTVEIVDILEKLNEWDKLLNDLMGCVEDSCKFDWREKIDELTKHKIMLQGEKVSLEEKIRQLEEALNNNEQKLQKMLDEKAELKATNEEAKRNVKKDDLNATKDKSLLQSELLKVELDLRERLQEENSNKLLDIEERYKKVLNDKLGSYKKEIDVLKNAENVYRQQLSIVLAECSQKMIELEENNLKLIQQLKDVRREYSEYKSTSMKDLKKYEDNIIESKKEFEVMKTNWERVMEERLASYVGVEKQCHKILKGISAKRKENQVQINQLEQAYNEKMNKFKIRHGLL